MNLKKNFKNKKVIVTGHTGFKGSWLTAWLKQLGAEVMGISLKPPTNPSHFNVSKINLGIKDIRLDILFLRDIAVRAESTRENIEQKQSAP